MSDVLQVLCIMVGVVISFGFLSKANVNININHTYPQPVDKPVDKTMTQEEYDRIYEENKQPTFDDVLIEVQKFIGGTDDAD